MINNSILQSILEINLYILITSVLWLVIKSKISFKWQRISALFIPLVSLLIWALKPLLIAKEMVYTTTILTPINVIPTMESITQNDGFSVNWFYVYGAISGILFLSFLYKIIRVLWFFKDASPQGAVSIKTSENEDSFSFFKFIHLRAQMDEDEKQVVLQHELIHYQKRHSFDLVVMEIFHSLFWINPLFFYLKKELVNIHEFEVDQEMYKAYKTNYMRHLLNYALGSVDSHYLLTSPFFNRLTITKRIQTMKTNKNKNNVWLLLSLPALALGLSVVSCESKTLPEAQSINYEEVLAQQKEDGVELDVGNLSKMPQFKGGNEEMYKFLSENMNYPKSAENEGIEGRVFVNFVVTEDGEISEAKILKGVNDAIDSEALRVINTMPAWEPAQKDGIPVKTAFTLPLVFQLTDKSAPTPPPPPTPSEHQQPAELSKVAEYPGGQTALFQYMGNNIQYSKEAQKEGISGKVIVQFTVKADGSIAYVIVKKGVSKALDTEALRVIKNMPDWTPAEKDGKAVASQMTLPIMFALE